MSSGINSRFQLLSRCERQVSYALLTHPPLSCTIFTLRICQYILVRLACVTHAASVYPEPGSNSQKNFFESQYLDSKFVVLNYFNSKFIDWFSCLGSCHARWPIHISNIVWLCQEIFQIFFIFFSFLFAPRVKPLFRILKGAWTVKHLFQAFFIFSCRETLFPTDEGFFSPNQAFLLIEKHLIWSIFGRPSINENYCFSATLCFCIMGINMSRFSIPMIERTNMPIV